MVNIFKYEQSISNFVAFISAVTFSFFTNSKLTFKKRPTATGYMIYIGIMGFLSILSGYIGDQCSTSPILTLISFSVISLVIGYFCAKYVVFKDKT
ncbi:GtrA family protein [Sodalis sp.]